MQSPGSFTVYMSTRFFRITQPSIAGESNFLFLVILGYYLAQMKGYSIEISNQFYLIDLDEIYQTSLLKFRAVCSDFTPRKPSIFDTESLLEVERANNSGKCFNQLPNNSYIDLATSGLKRFIRNQRPKETVM